MSCEYCTPRMSIRNTTFFEHIPTEPNSCSTGGSLGIRAVGADFFLHYEISEDVFFCPVDIEERWPIRHCPMCGSELPLQRVVDA